MPYITLTPLFLTAGLTPLSGLLRFGLSPTAYDVSLAGLEPWDDLWVSLPLARTIAAELGLLPALAAILDANIAAAWSLDEFDEGLSHNWRVPQHEVDAAAYSTDAITDPGLRFSAVQLLPRGQQIKTLVSAELRSGLVSRAAEQRRRSAFRMHQKLVQWSTQLYAVWIDVTEATKSSETPDGDSAEERKGRIAALLEDLKEVVLPPTWTDLCEWLQLLPSPFPEFDPPRQLDTHEGPTPGAQDEQLSMLDLAELSELRETESSLGDTLLHPHGKTQQECVVRLGSILRARMATLHRLALLSVPLLSSRSEESDTSPAEPDTLRPHPHPHPVAEVKPSTAAARPEQMAPRDELAQLHAKVDALTSKLDAFMAMHAWSSNEVVARHTPEAVPAQEPVESPRPVQTEDKAEPKSSTIEPAISILPTRETTPSLVVVLVSVVLFFILMQYRAD